jgi:hypothetical protein
VTDGWTGALVTGAHVAAAGLDTETNAAGAFQITPDEVCEAVDIDAPGYLHRHTNPCSRTTGITLWPVATDDEIQATKDAAFVGTSMRDPYVLAIGFAPDLQQRADVVGAWQAAAVSLSSLTSNKLQMGVAANAVPTDDGLIVATATSPPTCTHAWFQWDFSIAGFCWNPTQNYFVQQVAVPADLTTHADVALRAMLYASVMGPHHLPGLMNLTQPSTANEPALPAGARLP